MQIARTLSKTRARLGALALACAATLSLTQPAAAEVTFGSDEGPKLGLRGFGTLGLVHSTERNADYVGSVFQPNGAGAAHRWAHTVDSKVGVQADLTVNERLSAVLQLVAQDRYDNSYTPHVEWANVKYQVTPELYVRAGRTVATQFMISESRLVGYSYPWIRPPQELYGLVPITNKDGVDAGYRLHFGDVTNTLRASYGVTESNLPGGGNFKAREIFDASSTVDYGPATFRVSYATGRADLHQPQLETLDAGLHAFGAAAGGFGFASTAAQANAVADRYRFDNAPISLVSLGASYDRDAWLLMAEWARLSGHSVYPSSKAWYVTAGYRVRELTPYVTIARLTADHATESGIATAGLPAPLAAGAAQLNAGVNRLIANTAAAQRSVAVGARWDFAKNTALKVQYDRLDLDAGSTGRLRNLQPNFQSGGTANVFSVALDFVF